MDSTKLDLMIAHVAQVLEAREVELTELDQAIGDGDHGINMKRGSAAVLKISDDIVALPFGEAMKKLGMTLVMSIGGASGPLYGTLGMSIGKAAEDYPQSSKDIAGMLEQGLIALKARGKSDVGAKTMIDVLAPVQEALEQGASTEDVRRVADEALEGTKQIKATKGRAAFLGDRSVGHIDPGARSSNLIINAICDVLEGKYE